MAMAWAGGRISAGQSNLSHRFRRAVIDGNVPLAQRLARDAAALWEASDPSASGSGNHAPLRGSGVDGAFESAAVETRRTSAAETVRRARRDGLGDDELEGDSETRRGSMVDGLAVLRSPVSVAGAASACSSSGRISTGLVPAVMAAAAATAAASAAATNTMGEEDNPATPTLRSHWAASTAAAMAAAVSPVRAPDAPTNSSPGTVSGNRGPTRARTGTDASRSSGMSSSTSSSQAPLVSPFGLCVSSPTSPTQPAIGPSGISSSGAALTSSPATRFGDGFYDSPATMSPMQYGSHSLISASPTGDSGPGLVPRQGIYQSLTLLPFSPSNSSALASASASLPPWASCPLLPATIRYARKDPDERKYLKPAERAFVARRAALDKPFTIQNIDLTSPSGSEGRKASLILAIEHGVGIEMIEWLLEMQHEADGPSTDNDNNSVFALAAMYNRCDIIALYSAHPDVDVPTLIGSKSASEGRTALHWAAMKGHDQVMRLLLSLGADVDALDSSLNTPLHFASAWGHLTSVRFLKEVGARSDLMNKQNFSAQDWAFDGNIKIVLASFDEVAGSVAELGNARSVLMSRDQAAMMQYRRNAPRSAAAAAASASASAATAGGENTAANHTTGSSAGGGSGGGGGGLTRSPGARAAILRAVTSSSDAGKKRSGGSAPSASTLSPETLRAGMMPRSPPTSPPVHVANLR